MQIFTLKFTKRMSEEYMKIFMINFLWSWHKKEYEVFFFKKKMLGREGKHFASLIKLWNNLLHKNVLLGGRFKREGTDIYRWLIHVNIWQKPAQHCKAIILQLRRNIYIFLICRTWWLSGSIALGSRRRN